MTAKDTPFTPVTKEVYDNEDLVYADPDLKVAVGLVQFDAAGKSKPLVRPEPPAEPGKPPRKHRDTRYYPWGTYRSMKKVYQLEGKVRKSDNSATLDEVLPKALEQAFWDKDEPKPEVKTEN